MHIFDNAAEQVKKALTANGVSSRLVQLGDLGGYNHKPGDTEKAAVKSTSWTRSVSKVHHMKLKIF